MDKQIFSDFKRFRQNFATMKYLTQGAYALVYLVYDKFHNVLRVQKVIKLEKQIYTYQKFMNEAKLITQLNHPNVIKGYGYIIQKTVDPIKNQDVQFLHIIMDYVEGGELTQYVGKLKVQSILKIYEQMKSIIQYFRTQNLVHRNITLNNILVDKNMNIKICDFKRCSLLQDQQQTLRTVLKSGKRFYKAPQIHRQIVSNVSDLWGLGIILLQLHLGEFIKVLNENKIPVEDEQFPLKFYKKYKIDSQIKKIVVPLLQKDYTKRAFYDQNNKNKISSGTSIQQDDSPSKKKIFFEGITLKHIKTQKHLTSETTQLDLSHCNIGKLGAIQIAHTFPQLVDLQLNNNNIGYQGAIQIAKNLNNLKRLYLAYNNIGNEGTIQIAKNLVKLEILYLRNNNIKKQGAIQIGNNLINLNTLQLSYNQIQNKGVIHIAKKLINLKNLYLWNIGIDDQAVNQISNNLKNLITLDLWNNAISDTGATSIGRNLKKLTSLNLSNNNVTDEGAVSIVNHLKNLNVINFKNNKISQTAKNTILKIMPGKQVSL